MHKAIFFLSQTDTSASLPSQASTIKEHISITSSHLDYQNVQNDGEFIATVPKQYHSGEHDADNDIADDELHGNSLNRGPYFEVTAKNITAIAGQSAYLNCRVRNLGNRTVSERNKTFKSRLVCAKAMKAPQGELLSVISTI